MSSERTRQPSPAGDERSGRPDPGSVAVELARAEKRLEARTRELSLLQDLGRRAAEARTVDELFLAAISILRDAEELDVVLAAHALEGSPRCTAFLARPVDRDCLQAVTQRAGDIFGWGDDERPEGERVRLEGFDEHRGRRCTFEEGELIVLPLMRRTRVVACLLVLPSHGAAGGESRLAISAANQLAIHLDRILTERELQEDRFRTILDSMPQGVFLTDARMCVVQANPAAQKLFDVLGIRMGQGLEETLARLGLSEAMCEVRAGTAGVRRAEVVVESRGIFEVTLSRLRGAGGGADGLVLVFTDVTEGRRIQQQLAQSEKLSSLGEMLSGVAHELNNPLSSLLGYSQLLRGGCTEQPMARRLDVIQREAVRCQRIVQNLLSFARRREPERVAMSLNETVQSVVALLGYQLRVEGIDLATELDPGIAPVEGDPHELQQVLVNLVHNARQAIGTTATEKKIGLRTRADDSGGVVLEVEDSGPGIPDEIRARIFDPFFTTKEEGRGTGLGLSIVQGIVTSHAGTIEAREGAGGGALFRLRLPGGARGATSRREVVATGTGPRVRRGRILVVDDEESLATMLCEALAEEGHEVRAVADGREALACLDRDRFDLVISDLKMPGMDGTTLYDELQRLRPALCDRLLLTTGDTASDEPDRFVKRTGLQLLRKPFDLDRLRRAVRDRLGRSAAE